MMFPKVMSDKGSGSIEFIAVVAALFIPVVYFVLTVSTLHAANVAAAHAAREAGRVFMSADSVSAGRARATAAVSLALADQRIAESPRISIDCSNPCMSPGSAVRVVVAWEQPLPWVPPVFEAVSSWPISSEQSVWIDDFRPAGVA